MDIQPVPAGSTRKDHGLPSSFLVQISGVGLTSDSVLQEATADAKTKYRSCAALPTSQLAHLTGRLPGNELFDSAGISFSSSFHAQLLDVLHDGVYFMNLRKEITYWNRGAEALSGYTAAEVLGKHCFDGLLEHVDEAGRSICNRGCPLSKTIVDGKPRESEVYLRHKLGHRVPVCIQVMPIQNSAGQIIGAVEVFSDVSAKKKIETRVSELEHFAFRDALTHLPNRRYMEFKLAQALQEHQQFGREYGLLMSDVDHFKRVNDTYGHDVGDTVLKTIAETLVRGLRSQEVVGRWGGEEFLILLPDVNATQVGDVAERCRNLVAESGISVGTSRLHITLSIGGTVLNQISSPGDAIRVVDDLMYQSKKSGRNCATIG